MNSFEEHKTAKSTILHRLLLVYLVLALWCTVLVLRLVDLQVFKADHYREQVAAQQKAFAVLGPKRGDILDRNLEELAISIETESVFARPAKVQDPLKAAEILARVLEEPQDILHQKLVSNKDFVFLKRKIPPRQSRKLDNLTLPGIARQPDSKRVYPNLELAAHVLGFVGVDNDGLGGLEYRFNEELKGERRQVRLRVDARRNSFYREASSPGDNGSTLVLTLDRTLQHIGEQVLAKTVESTGARSGAVIMMNPHNGEVLAMCSYPTFNPNHYQDFKPSVRRNRGILNIYEPGSTFKIVTLSGVLNENLGQPLELIDCRPGTVRLAGKVYREATRDFEDLTVLEVLSRSSNIGTVKLGLRLGEERLHKYIRSFGFGEETGIELPGEEKGLLRPTSQWSRLSIGALSIGQEIGVTPLQMTRAVAVLANGGYRVSPHIVRYLMNPYGDLTYRPAPSRSRILTESTVKHMKRAMASVIEEGTGQRAALRGYTAAGKTGTAQKIVNGRYSNTRYVASFVGFAPIDDPGLITSVVIDEPKGIAYGGYVAGPAFKKIMERALIHLEIPQDQPARLPDDTVAVLDTAEGTASTAEVRPENAEQSRDKLPTGERDQPVTWVVETPLDSAEHGQVLTVGLGSERMPDFTGLSLRKVAKECARLGLELKVNGRGIAVGQRPSPGTRILKGSVCEVFFSGSDKLANESEQVAIRGEAGSQDND